MRIGFCGAHGVGKTTLIDELSKLSEFKNYERSTSISRWVQSLGIPINEDGNDNTQRLIAMRHVYQMFMHSHIIMDRTILDVIVYSKYHYDRGHINEDTYLEIGAVWLNLMPMYNVLFYMKPEFPLVLDGTRSENEDFRQDIYELFERAIEKYEIPVVRLTGTVEERVNQVKEWYNDSKRA